MGGTWRKAWRQLSWRGTLTRTHLSHRRVKHDRALDLGGANVVAGDDDDVVNAADLGLLISEWGCKGTCSGDLNGDGMVNAADLGLLISYWGPCP